MTDVERELRLADSKPNQIFLKDFHISINKLKHLNRLGYGPW